MCVLLQINLAQLQLCRALWWLLSGRHCTQHFRLQFDRPLPALVCLGGMCVAAHAAHRLSMACDPVAWLIGLGSLSLALTVQLLRNGEKDSWGPLSNLDRLLPQLILVERARLAVRSTPQIAARAAAAGGGRSSGAAAGGTRGSSS